MIVKLWPGRNDEIKSNLAKRIAHTVAEELKVDMGDKLVGKHEHCYVEKEFKGKPRKSVRYARIHRATLSFTQKITRIELRKMSEKKIL